MGETEVKSVIAKETREISTAIISLILRDYGLAGIAELEEIIKEARSITNTNEKENIMPINPKTSDTEMIHSDIDLQEKENTMPANPEISETSEKYGNGIYNDSAISAVIADNEAGPELPKGKSRVLTNPNIPSVKVDSPLPEESLNYEYLDEKIDNPMPIPNPYGEAPKASTENIPPIEAIPNPYGELKVATPGESLQTNIPKL